jgi:hypothetical protein
MTITSISTTPANTAMSATIYNSSGGAVTSGSSTTSIALNVASLAAGTYTAWIVPQYPATSSMTVNY